MDQIKIEDRYGKNSLYPGVGTGGPDTPRKSQVV